MELAKGWLLNLLPLFGGFLGCLFWIALKKYQFAFIKHVLCAYGIYSVCLFRWNFGYSRGQVILLFFLLLLEYAAFSYLLWLTYRLRSRKDNEKKEEPR